MKQRGWSLSVIVAIVAIVVAVSVATAPPAAPQMRVQAPSFEVEVSLLPVSVAVRSGDVTFEIEF